MFKIFLFLILLVNVSFSAEKLQIAILDFQNDSRLSVDEVRAITGRFQSELINTNSFKVLDRKQVQSILEEQGFQQSGVCSSSDCQLEMGRLLGVERMITGSISIVGSLTTVTLNMINVETGQIEKSYNEDVRGGMETILTQTCKRLASRIAGLDVQKNQPIVVKSKPSENSKTNSSKKGLSALTWSGIGVGVLAVGGVAFWLLQPESSSKDQVVTVQRFPSQNHILLSGGQ